MDRAEEEFEKEPIKITEEALSKALEIQNKTPCWFGMDLRLYLDGKGCDGFFYGVTFDKKTSEDLIFENSYNGQKLNIIVDQKTLEFTEGSLISWSSHNGTEGFLVENPRHRKFRGKFYKRGYWRKRMDQEKTEA